MKTQNSLMIVVLLAAAAAGAQDVTGPVPALAGAALGNDRMVTPTPVSNQSYSMSFAIEEPRSNYLSGAIAFGSGYDDNIFMSTPQIHDVNYTISPSITLRQSRSLLQWDLNYSPQFTLYQNHSSYDQIGQNFASSLEYRLSPHVTLSLNDTFIRTSNTLGQLYQNPNDNTSNGTQPPPDVIITPLADRLSNVGSAEITYQFALNGMVGASGTFSELHYLNPDQAPGLYDSSARSANAFYTHRLSGKHYIGASYSFQDLLASPGNAETQTNSVLLFYTLYLNPTSSIAVFAGPEHSVTAGIGPSALVMWSPVAGVSFGWQGAHTSFSAGLSQKISQGGGLAGAVRSRSADLSLRRQLTRNWTVALAGDYSKNTYLQTLSSSSTGGHTFSANASISRSLGQHLELQLGYTRLQQNYSDLAAPNASSDRNRAWMSLSYQFQRPLGR
jgi:hypothetical protein